MDKKKQEVDIIDKVLEACYKAYPQALFIMSLMHQYEERGSLSKKQLQGLYEKARKVNDLAPNLLATLEARILKMPNRFKSDIQQHAPLYTKDEYAGKLIKDLLIKYPQHKQVLFLKAKYENNESLTPGEISDLEKFKRLLL